MKHIICLFVVLKTTEDRRASKRKDSVTMYPAFSGMQVERGSYFNSIKTTFPLIFKLLFLCLIRLMIQPKYFRTN